MPAAAITKTTDGLVFRDQFTRTNSDTVGNNWDETVRGEQSARILSNELHSNNSNSPGIEEVYQPGDSGATNPIPTGDTIVQLNVDYDSATGHRAQLIIRTDEGEAGTGSEDAYSGFLDKNEASEQLQIHNIIAGSSVQDVKVEFDPTTTKRGIRLILKDTGSTNVLTFKVSTSLTNLQDLAKPFTDATGTFTDSTDPIPASGDTTDFAILTLRDLTMDEYIMTGRNVVITGVTTGFKGSVDAGSTKVEESSGTVTIDIDAVAMPMADVRIYDASDVLQATLTEDIWGGGIYAFSAFTADLPTLLHGDITGSAAAL